MKDNIPDFIKDATNVYRTKGYIVKQVIGIQYDCKENNVVFSHDTFYKRTPKRDKEYEIFFCHRRHIDGIILSVSFYLLEFYPPRRRLVRTAPSGISFFIAQDRPMATRRRAIS